MIPSVLSSQLREAIGDFLTTTYPFSTPEFKGLMDGLVGAGDAFKGPYLSLQLPFRNGASGGGFFPEIPLPFPAYVHQEKAFERLALDTPLPTIVATGTGSGKTESFLLPILDYCRKHVGEPGIKAILIYPMNALATDQARRIARLVNEHDSLHGKVRAGLYIGSKDAEPRMHMSPTGVITDRESIRLDPPDILLTNYKMLDYLMVRPGDQKIWELNGPGTFRFLVVDELHTFDGAQGTDLACLIRRLKSRLASPDVCSIGTSATLGSEGGTEKLRSYAESIFDAEFEEASVVGEERLAAAEFLEGRGVVYEMPSLDALPGGVLDPSVHERDADYVAAQFEAWFGESVDVKTVGDDAWRQRLGDMVCGHEFFHTLLGIVAGGSPSYENVIRQLAQRIEALAEEAPAAISRILDSFIALISTARRAIKTSSGADLHLPLVSVRHQLWMRELKRMVATVSPSPRLRWSDDLTDKAAENHLPVIHCRDCGTGGWVTKRNVAQRQLDVQIRSIYDAYFGHDPHLSILFPDTDGEIARSNDGLPRILCTSCLSINSDAAKACEECGASGNDLIRVFAPDYVTTNDGHSRSNAYCPSCQSRYGLNIVGSQAASLTSVMIGQLYASGYNDDKKLLTFSDSVQDASHRAGFFQSRTYRITVRSALQQWVERQEGVLSLKDVADGFVSDERKKRSPEDFVGTFIAPDLMWREDYEELDRDGKLPAGSRLDDLVADRLHWEVFVEYGFRSRIGRTLERTGSSLASPNPGQLESIASTITTRLKEEIGGLETLDDITVRRFLEGIVSQLRTSGGIEHPALVSYVSNKGSYFNMSQRRIAYMPRIGKRTRTPAFLTSGKMDRFDSLPTGKNKTWYARWAVKCFNRGELALPERFEVEVYRLVLPALEKAGIVRRFDVGDDQVWGLAAEHLFVVTSPSRLRCTKCSNEVSAPASEEDIWLGAPCLRHSCSGMYEAATLAKDYYRRLYRTADIRRIVAAEHTGLLERDERERLEERFMNGNRAWDPNLISCTPTLEMGIDIGDLSSLILCSVPPTQSNYLQRIGRAGRRDGNALAVTVANARSHDLFFFAAPEEMIAGSVDPPGAFLDAPAVLERQLSAYTLDRWVASGIKPSAVPSFLGDVLKTHSKNDGKAFPATWLDFVKTNEEELLSSFLALFSDTISAESRAHLNDYLMGSKNASGSLAYRVHEGLIRRLGERESISKKAGQITGQIAKLKAEPHDLNFDDTLRELQRERSSLRGLVRSIEKTNVYGFLTDEGLLPNYAFPEEGVTLKSVIYRKKLVPDDDGAYDTWTLEFGRGGSSALHELAPESTFYAGGRRVEVDQVDLELSEIEEWRFCSECSYSLRNSPTEIPAKACPSCGSPAWPDAGRLRNMVRLRQVFARTSDQDSRSYDDSDDRNATHFVQSLAIQFKDDAITQAFAIEEASVPYGFEFIQRADFREVNFGKPSGVGEPVRIAGIEIPRRGFELCMHCGKVQHANKPPNHDYSCPAKKEEGDAYLASCTYLYREFSSEAIRMLLPFTTAGSTERELQSFIAALHLGLKKNFGGQIDHLKVAVQEEPIADTGHRRRYLFLYDSVPGGTGYLKELMREPQLILQVFEGAANALSACSCNQDPESDGCYRCLYAYRHSWQLARISRGTALGLLSSILEYRDTLKPVKKLSDVSLNVLLGSELEKKFILELQRRCDPVKGENILDDVVRGKPGYVLTLGGNVYYIEPQVSLGESEGVFEPSKADFVIRAALSENLSRPVVVFTDGFAFHHDRQDKDTAQRMALLRSGKYLTWSITWDDIEQAAGHEDKWENYVPLDSTRPKSNTYLQFVNALDARYQTAKVGNLSSDDSLSWLLSFLRDPDEKAWTSFAFAHACMNLNQQSGSHGWTSTLERLAPDFVREDVPDGADDLYGVYQRVREGCAVSEFTLAARIPIQAVQSLNLEGMWLAAQIDDSLEAKGSHKYERAWAGFLRVMNLYQFLPGAFFTSRLGMESGAYDSLDVEQVDESEFAWNDALEMVDSACRGLLVSLQAHVAPPTVGYDHPDTNGQVIASAEIVWVPQRIAVLMDYQMGFKSAFETSGWTVFTLQEVLADSSVITALFE